MKDDIFDIAAVCAGAICGFLWGNMDGFFIAFIAMITLDYITGLTAAFATKTVSSKVGFSGLCKKLVIIMVVAVAHIIDANVINAGGVLRNAVICYFIANEGLSMIENAARMGIPIPKKLMQALAQLKGESDNDDTGKADTKKPV